MSKDGSSRYQSRKVSSNRDRDTKTSSRRSKQKHRSKSPWKYANRSSSSASRKSSSTASTAASTAAASTAASSYASTAPPKTDDYGQLLATQIVDTNETAEEIATNVISSSGSDITTGPVDDLLFALGDAINKGANEVEDFVEITIADGFESIKNSWDRFTVGLTLMYGDNSTIGTDFSDEMEVKLVKERGLGGGLEIIEEDSQGTAKSSITGNIKSQVQGLIDNFFLVEM